MYLPPYSPDYNPIEEAFAKLKALLRRRAGGVPARRSHRSDRQGSRGSNRERCYGKRYEVERWAHFLEPSRRRYYALGIGCFWNRQRSDRGTMTILAQSDPKELPTASGIRRVEVWGFLSRAVVAVSDHLRLAAV
jgi:hypothetical protein